MMEHKNCKPSNSTQPSEFVDEEIYERCLACGLRRTKYSAIPVADKTSYKKKSRKNR